MERTRRANASGTGRSTGPSGTTRAGRRERRRPLHDRRSFLERNRATLLGFAGLAALALLVGVVFLGASGSTYACSTIWEPGPGDTVAGRPGAVQPDMGRNHVRPGDSVRYTYCPPASGPHYNARGLGPITPRFYGPDEVVEPQGWVHNLEHGALVVLYRDGIDPATERQLQGLVSSLPTSPVCQLRSGIVGPVIARFDQMNHPFAAIVWDRVLYLDTLDVGAISEFFLANAEHEGTPEIQCVRPSPSPAASPSPAQGASPSPSPAEASPSPAEASPSPAPSATPSPSPS